MQLFPNQGLLGVKRLGRCIRLRQTHQSTNKTQISAREFPGPLTPSRGYELDQLLSFHTDSCDPVEDADVRRYSTICPDERLEVGSKGHIFRVWETCPWVRILVSLHAISIPYHECIS